MNKKKTQIVALITARGGSKGIPRKNVRDVGGKPLIAWSIEAGLNAKSIDRVIVTSDDDEILSVAKSFGAETIRRPAELATDTASSASAMIHALQASGIDKEDLTNHFTMLLQPTSPLRSTTHIDEAVHLLLEGGGDALTSVREVDNKYLKAFISNKEGYLTAAAANSAFPNTARQLLPKLFMPNGAIYIVTTSDFLANSLFLGKKTIPYVMDDASSVDIDTPADLDRVGAILKERAKKVE
jgi:CMP-N,N'-diacetyllegionaminic acid synthase